ncbi:MAG: glycosyltransferase [Candidatus Planktophila sp.]|nr:glycosyltransferase [Candidatus Planktophila sp.]
MSILLPTVNPNERVVSIISELLECEKFGFELVVSLNAPSQALELESRYESDSRLVVSIEPQRLNVAENWTRAVEKSSGKYLWLIGDDDYILREQLLQVLELLEKENVDCLSFNGWSYIFPSEMTKNLPLSRPRHFNYKKSILGVLTNKKYEEIIKNMYRFVPLIPLNMQLTIFSRDTIEKIGGRFKMPFPDHIALMEFLAVAKIWKVVDERWCIVGMAPSSFGNSAYQSSDSAGEAYLGLTQSELPPMPGNILNSVMLSWLETLSSTNQRFQKYRPSRGNYILRQIGVSYRRWRSRDIDFLGLLRNIKCISRKDLLLAIRSLFSIKNVVLIFKILTRKPGPEKIIGAKFETAQQIDIKGFADDIRLPVYS